MPDLPCPVCSADVYLDGSESSGDELICTYCHCPLKVTRLKDGKFKITDNT